MYTALIILIYNNKENICSFIRSFERYNTADTKLIIIDNGSSDKNVGESVSAFLQSKYNEKGYLECDDNFCPMGTLPYCTFLRSSINGGFSAGNNKGLRLAYADDTIDNVFVVNDDIIFVDDIIPTLVRKLETLPKAGMVCPISLKQDGSVDMDCVRLLRPTWEELLSMVHYTYRKKELVLRNHPEYLNDEYIKISPPIGCSILMKKKMIKDLGGYDENVFLYHEEYILHKKFATIDAVNYAIPSCRLIHVGSASTSKCRNGIVRKASLESTYYFYSTYHKLNFITRCALNLTCLLGKLR